MAFSTVRREIEFKKPGKEFQYPELQKITLSHVESFNNLFKCDDKKDSRGLLERAVDNLRPKIFLEDPNLEHGKLNNMFKVWIQSATVSNPVKEDREQLVDDRFAYPTESRERKASYCGKLSAQICWQINDGPVESEVRSFGNLPIMVRSSKCNTYKMLPKDLVKHKEEADEMGGYFIINGNEKIIRLLINTRRNHVLVIERPTFENRGPDFTRLGAVCRSVRNDETSQTTTIHLVKDGNCVFKFYRNKKEYLVPAMLILKCLIEASDQDIFEAIIKGDLDNTFYLDRVEILLRGFKDLSLYTRAQALDYLGGKFQPAGWYPHTWSNRQVAEAILEDVVYVHLDNNVDKFNLLTYTIRKLYSTASGVICADNLDTPQFQEVLLGGHLISAFIKEKFDDFLTFIQRTIRADYRRKVKYYELNSRYMSKMLQSTASDIGAKLHFFLATGNLESRSGLDQMQASGYTITAEKLNYLRYISHFQCIHRGAFFTEMKTTTVRKLLPEAWGFLCPVHTPDGSPCGLLNHLAHKCHIVTRFPDVDNIPQILISLGINPVVGLFTGDKNSFIVHLDGKIVGYCSEQIAIKVAKQLRKLKTEHQLSVPLDLEVGFVPKTNGGQYQGLYLFSKPCRMTRPVKFLENDSEDIVGSFEQVYMEIACMNEDIVPGITTHIEFAPTNILSVVANLTPFSDFNQSPRNMYQCQMGKQTMGTPTQVMRHRTDNKMYSLQTGQTPIVRPKLHNAYGMDGFPNGTNAVVCVISYTGYDMEDAMILNKSAHERGFGYGTIYKSEVVNIGSSKQSDPNSQLKFGFAPGYRFKKAELENIDKDGFPHVGVRLTDGDPFYAYYDVNSGHTKVVKFKSSEDAIVDNVILAGANTSRSETTSVVIKYRVPRPAVIGDKFSSRHGQKGVCSQKWPAVDMPFSESGIQPDVIINPHAFPSRMTIGMFIESLAGKAGALHGLEQDATPFTFNEHNSAADFFGEQLVKAGYSYHGNEPMYSGITGEEFKVDIYIGVVYYQRLRHMVSDKYQVRTLGPIHSLTHQPIKGRKRMGGIRFGEMERDSLLAHGTSFLLQDRLMNCSDYCKVYICRLCGSFLSTISNLTTTSEGSLTGHKPITCKMCKSSQGIDLIAIPYVFRYLTTELMAMGIKMKLEVKP